MISLCVSELTFFLEMIFMIFMAALSILALNNLERGIVSQYGSFSGKEFYGIPAVMDIL